MSHTVIDVSSAVDNADLEINTNENEITRVKDQNEAQNNEHISSRSNSVEVIVDDFNENLTEHNNDTDNFSHMNFVSQSCEQCCHHHHHHVLVVEKQLNTSSKGCHEIKSRDTTCNHNITSSSSNCSHVNTTTKDCVTNCSPDNIQQLSILTNDSATQSEHQSSHNVNNCNEIICRICLDNVDEGDLIAPCKCSGSTKYAHESCMLKWFFKSSKKSCEVCLGNVNVTPVGYKPVQEVCFLYLFF